MVAVCFTVPGGDVLSVPTFKVTAGGGGVGGWRIWEVEGVGG